MPLSLHDFTGGTPTYSATNLPPGLSINATTGQITGTVAAGADGGSPYTVTVTATDGTHTSTQDFAWRAAAVVTVADPGGQVSGAGAVVSLPITASDINNLALTYSATGLPPGLSINSSTGVISGTIALGAESGSPYTAVVTASDGTHSGSDTFSWIVTHVALTNPGPQTNTDGTAVSLALQGRDADGDPVTYSATGLPTGLAINSSTGVISGTLPANASAGSAYVVTVSASDGTHTTSRTFLWQVVHVSVTNPGSQTGTEGHTVSLPIQAVDGGGATVTYSAGGLPPGLSINSTTGLISGTIGAGDAANGPYTVAVAASDGTVSNSQTFAWTVSPHIALAAPSDQSSVEGNTVSLQVQATDPDSDPLTYSAAGLPAGLTINGSTGLISGTVSAGDSASSPYAVTITASDGTYSDNISFGWTVTHGNNHAPTLTSPGLQGNSTGEEVALQVQAADADGDLLTYSATGLPDGLSIDPFSGQITGTLADDAASTTTYAVQVTVTDGNGGSTSQTFSWVVTPNTLSVQATPVSGTEGSSTGNVTAATFTTPDLNSQAGDFTASITWGDGQTSLGQVTGGDGTFTVTAQNTYADSGSYLAGVTLSLGNGAWATVSGTNTVAGAPLTITGGFQLGAVAGQSTLLNVATFTDADPNGPTTDEYAATINWGDGSPTEAGYVTFDHGGLGTIYGWHSYSSSAVSPFPYTVTVTITDGDAAPVTGTSSVIVGNLYAGVWASANMPGFWDDDPNGAASAFSATVDWGDGNVQSVGVVGANGSYALATPLGHLYAADSLDQPGKFYLVTVTITDHADNAMLSGGGTALVVRPDMLLAVGNVAPGQPSLSLSNVEVADFAEPDWLDPSSEFTASIDWGDGTTGSGTVEGSDGLFQVFGSHTYADVGVYNIVVTISQGWSTQEPARRGGAQADAEPLRRAVEGPSVVPGAGRYTYCV